MGFLSFFTRSNSQKKISAQDAEIDFADRGLWDSLDMKQGVKVGSDFDALDEGKMAGSRRGINSQKEKHGSGIFARIFSSHQGHDPQNANEALSTSAANKINRKSYSTLSPSPSSTTRLSTSPKSLTLSASSPRKSTAKSTRNKTNSKKPSSDLSIRRNNQHGHPKNSTKAGGLVDDVPHREASSLTIGKPQVISSSLEMHDPTPTNRRHAHKKTNSVIVDKKALDSIVPISSRAKLSAGNTSPSKFGFSSSSKMQPLSRKPARSSLKLRDVRDEKDGLPVKQFIDGRRVSITFSAGKNDSYTDSDGDYTDCSDSDEYEGELEADEISLSESFKESREAAHRERLTKFTWAPSKSNDAPSSSSPTSLNVINESSGEEEPPRLERADAVLAGTNLGNAAVRVNVIPPTPTPPVSPDSTSDISNSPLLQATNPTSTESLSSTPSFYNLRTLFDSIDVNDARQPSATSTISNGDYEHEDPEDEIPSTPDLVYGHRHDRGMSGFQTISTIATSSSEAKTDSPSALSMHVDIWEDDDAVNNYIPIGDIGIRYQRESVDADRMLASSIASRNSPAKSVRFALSELPDISQSEVPSSVANPDPVSRTVDDQQQQGTQEELNSSSEKEADEIDLEKPISSNGPYAKVIKNYLQLRHDNRKLEIIKISLESEISKLQRSRDKLSVDRDDLKSELEILRERFMHTDINLTDAKVRLENALANANEQEIYILDLNRKLIERDTTIEGMRNQLGSLQEDLEELNLRKVDQLSSLTNTVPSSSAAAPANSSTESSNPLITDRLSKRTAVTGRKTTRMFNPSYTLSMMLHELTWTDMRANKDKIEELQDEIDILNLKASSSNSESRVDTSYHLPTSAIRTHQRARLLSTTSTLPDTIPEDTTISEPEVQKLTLPSLGL